MGSLRSTPRKKVYFKDYVFLAILISNDMAPRYVILFTNTFMEDINMASLGQLKMRLEQKKAKIAKLTAQLKDERTQMAEIKEQIKTAK